ncbi:MAG TPA: membrane protein insertion efficiency factor YidD [Gammaproteobacteria bacterium]|nr:membrane protein insertion efficiency factor YidD [Gammaproteobacteria bacterium]
MARISNIPVSILRFYKRWISPLLGQHCRFYPTCSEYAATAIAEYGVIRGGWMSVQRVFRCNPWNEGGLDYVPCKHKDHVDG